MTTIRRHEATPTSLQLMVFRCGSFQAPVSFFLDNDAPEFLEVPVLAYLIRHPVKGFALFDTGLGYRFQLVLGKRLPPDKVGFNFTEKDGLATGMRLAGFDPNDVRWIINSHLHPDHCGGNAGFPNATIVVQRPERDCAYANAGGLAYTLEDFDTGQPILAVDGEHDLFGDRTVELLPTYGHTPGHQSARVRLASGEVILTADCCYLARTLDTMGVPAGNVDREASLAVLRRLKEMRANGTRLFFGHDPDQWQGAPQGKIFL